MSDEDPVMWLSSGAQMNASQALELRRGFDALAQTFEARVRLLGYALLASDLDADWRDFAREQWLWCIAHEPRSRLHKFRLIPENTDLATRVAACEQWRVAVARLPDDAEVLEHAGLCFVATEEWESARAAFEQLERADPLDPDRPRWTGRCLAQVDGNDSCAEQALAAFQRSLALDQDRSRRAVTLRDAARLAVRMRRYELTREYALELLDAARSCDLGWMSGNAHYEGHRLLGHVALASGDVETAERELLESGRTTGSPQLNSFGPELDLANALLQLGRTAVVIKFLELCERFWNPAASRNWIAKIRSGERPELNRFTALRDDFLAAPGDVN
jgi:tetratricopeptide (TPR) repeat protein